MWNLEILRKVTKPPDWGKERKNMELIGTTHNNVRVLYKGSLAKLRRIAKDPKANLKHSAIYRQVVGSETFHNATDERFLVEHYHDPYWLNRGVGSRN